MTLKDKDTRNALYKGIRYRTPHGDGLLKQAFTWDYQGEDIHIFLPGFKLNI